MAKAKLTAEQKEEMVKLHGMVKLTQAEIGRAYGVSQVLVNNILMDSGKTKPNHCAEVRKCSHCGNPVSIAGQRRRARLSFCCEEHYWQYLQNPDYQRSIWGTRLARRKVSEVFNLADENVVHHADTNDNNNDISNLWVFSDEASHTSYHRGGDVEPIWKG